MVYVNPAGFPTPGLSINNGWKVFIALMVMIVVSGVFVMARFATRKSQGQLGSDDWAILTSLCFFIVQTTLWALSVRAGYGADYLALAEWQRILFNKWWFLGTIFWFAVLAMYKTSVLLLLHRIFVQRRFRYACWTLMVINGCWALGNIFGWIFQCIPVPSMWGGLQKGALIHCFNQDSLWISIVVWDVSTDVAILLLPQPMIWRLSLKVREKLLLTAMFLLGAIVVLFSLMSCSAIMTHLQAANTDKNKYSLALANLFQVLEAGMGIVGACLPIMRQPLTKLFPKWIRRSEPRAPYYYDTHSSDQYALQNVPDEKQVGLQAGWNSVSVSRPEHSRSTSRRSDELDIIRKPDDNQRTAHQIDSKERHCL